MKPQVIEINSWKKTKEAERETNELRDYLNVLSFNELIAEAQFVIKELKSGKVSKDLSNRSHTIISEFNKRIEIESPELANYLKLKF